MTSTESLTNELRQLQEQSPSQRWAVVAARAVAAGWTCPQCYDLWDAAFHDWNPAEGPRPLWTPTPAVVDRANLTAFMTAQGMKDLTSLRQWASTASVDFWRAVCQQLQIHWADPPRHWLDLSHGLERAVWARDARLNIVLSCLPELVPTGAGHAARAAAEPLDPQRPVIKWQSANGPLETISAHQLARQVQRLASRWQAAGWSGRRVALLLPMSPIGVAVYLTALYCGSTVISIADSFSAPEIANRLLLSEAEVVLTMDALMRGGKCLPLLPRVHQATSLPCLVIGAVHGRGATDWDGPWLSDTPQGLRPQDWDWNDWLAETTDPSAVASHAVPPPASLLAADRPIHLLFSSGTTGDPKVIPWTPLTPIKCAADAYFHQDLHADDVVAWPTSLGWMMGPWLIFATLINRSAMALFEDAPLGSDFGRFVQDARVTVLGLVPSIVKSWRSTRAMESYDWSHLRLFSSTGESSQREDYFYLSWLAGFKPIIEYCGGTEIGGGYISSTVLEPNAPATFTGPAIGLDVEILDAGGQLADEGELYLVPPSIGLSQSLLNRDHYATYYAEAPRSPSTGRPLRKHGDHFRRLPSGYYEAGGRTDDTMNLGGIKVSSLELERIINRVPGVRESAAVACSLAGGPDQLIVFLVLVPSTEATAESQWLARLNQAIREELNPLFKASQLSIVSELPRTASNKILRRTLRDQWQKAGGSEV